MVAGTYAGKRSVRVSTLTVIAPLLLGLLVAGCSDRPAEPASPSVLVVCIDTLRADALGVYGASPAGSPVLDQLAADGLVFDNAFSTSSWTRPAVPSLLTGLFPFQHGMLETHDDGVDVLPDSVQTLAEHLSAAGYRSAAFVQNDHLRRRYSNLDQGFATYVDDAGKAPLIAQRFLSWLDQADDRPFFAYLHFLDVHWPYEPIGLLGSRGISDADRNRVASWGVESRRWWLLREGVRDGELELDDTDLALLRRLYQAELTELDAVLGHLFEVLRARGIWDEMLVIVTSDHGEGFMEHGRLDHGYAQYDELLRVPLILRLPASRGRTGRVENQVQIVDLTATVLELAGISGELPSGSRSLLQAAGGGEQRQVLAQETHGKQTWTALRRANWKYLRKEHQGGGARRRTLPADLVVGDRVRAKGVFVGGRFLADEVKRVSRGDEDLEIRAPLAALVRDPGVFEIMGLSVQVDPDVRFDDGEGRSPFDLLSPGDWVRVDVEWKGPSLRADRVALLAGESERVLEQEGVVTAFGVDTNGVVRLQLGGREVVVNEQAEWKNFSPDQEVIYESGRAEPALREELYDLAADPGEQVNLAGKNTGKLAEMATALAALQASLAEAPRHKRAGALDEKTRRRLQEMGYLE
ncbi:MAG TPA: hypothetical protein EYG16_07715 [Deltaproteobacteria bacterium]|nr:hypothetical protein [Candidatus Binatota bacterium]HIL13541.1 hypothetical protein [Deltaproteobacteria bacterium]